METIIQEIAKKIIEGSIENIEKALKEKQNISEYINNTQNLLNSVGVDLVKYLLDTCNESLLESKKRKQEWYVDKRNQEKTYSTIFGDIHYKRTYYKKKKTGEYSYLSDEYLGIKTHERMDMSLRSEIIKNALDVSYSKSGKNTVKTQEFSKQTVMNSIRSLEEIENDIVEIAEPKKEVKILFIEADEDHISMQDGSNKQQKLVYVHEGIKKIGRNRFKLINPRYFTGIYKESEQLWLEVSEYIEKAYESEKTEKVYLSGDGARWIKEGLNWIDKSQYVLDRFHLSKYVKIATAHMPHTTNIMWEYINQGQKQWLKDLFLEIIESTKTETKKAAVKEARSYIINNWEGIRGQYNRDYIGCSAEGHVSHILSARLSSRPLGWCEKGADQMARLRVYRENGGKIYDLVKYKNEKTENKRRIEKLAKQVIKKKTSISYNEIFDNIPIINKGKRTWASEMLKNYRGA